MYKDVKSQKVNILVLNKKKVAKVAKNEEY